MLLPWECAIVNWVHLSKHCAAMMLTLGVNAAGRMAAVIRCRSESLQLLVFHCLSFQAQALHGLRARAECNCMFAGSTVRAGANGCASLLKQWGGQTATKAKAR